MMDENIRRMLRDVANSRAVLPPGGLQDEVNKALTARQEAMSSLAAYRQFKAPSFATNPFIDPGVLEGLADIRQQTFRAALGGLKELPRTGIQRAVANIQNTASPWGLGRVLQDTEAMRGVTESIRQNGLQRALRDVQSVLRTPEVQGMFVDMEPVRKLLEQAEAMEDDAGDVQEKLPESLDQEAFLSLDIHTLTFIVAYFNTVFAALTAILIVGTYGVEQSQTLTNIEEACVAATIITDLALRALKRKASDQNTD